MKVNRRTKRDAKKLFRLCLDMGRLNSERVREWTRRIIEGKHRGYVALLWQFHRLVKLENDRHVAEVASAVPLQLDLRDRITEDLDRRYGPGLQIRFVEDRGLIAGMRVWVGNDVFDGSVRYKLDQLQKSFCNGDGWQANT